MTDVITHKFVSEAQCERLRCTTDAAALRHVIRKIHQLEADESLRARALVDYHFYNVAFAKEQGMAPLQFASFYSIACEMLLRDQEDSFRTSMQSFSDFKKLVVAHSVQDPPHSLQIFSREQAVAVVDYMLQSYFRHHKLYVTMLTPKVALEVRQVGGSANQVPRRPRPLQEAIPLETRGAPGAE